MSRRISIKLSNNSLLQYPDRKFTSFCQTVLSTVYETYTGSSSGWSLLSEHRWHTDTGPFPRVLLGEFIRAAPAVISTQDLCGIVMLA